jgi:hypothetical protein
MTSQPATPNLNVSAIGTAAVAVLSLVTLALAACGQEQPVAQKAVAHSVSSAALEWGECPPIFPAGCQIAVLNGDPTKPNSDIFLRVPGQYEIPAHSHTSAERMVLVTGELTVTYEGQAPVTLSAGSYAFGPSKLAHKASCISADPCTLFIAFEQPVDAEPHKGELAGP